MAANRRRADRARGATEKSLANLGHAPGDLKVADRFAVDSEAEHSTRRTIPRAWTANSDDHAMGRRTAELRRRPQAHVRIEGLEKHSLAVV